MMNKFEKLVVASGIGFLGVAAVVNIKGFIEDRNHDKKFNLEAKKEDLIFEMTKSLTECRRDLNITNNVYLDTEIKKDSIKFMLKIAEATTESGAVKAYVEFCDYITELYKNN